MKDLLLEYIPNAPALGLYVVPYLPSDKVNNALRDYAKAIRPEDVLALYDATLLGTAKDGAVFLADRFVFQNNDLSPAQTVPYADIVRVTAKKKLLGGQKVLLDVNQARATVSHELDFSGKPAAAEYVARFLHEAMIRGAAAEMDRTTSTSTNLDALSEALDGLVDRGQLDAADRDRILKLFP